MTARLPATLTLCFERATWREARNPHFDEDITESGKPIRSKKPGTPLTPVAGSIIVTDAEKTDWNAFHNTTCAEGSLPFEARDPRTGSLQVYWWLGPPEFSDVATRIRMSLQIARE
jgi:hypothetical protein